MKNDPKLAFIFEIFYFDVREWDVHVKNMKWNDNTHTHRTKKSNTRHGENIEFLIYDARSVPYAPAETGARDSESWMLLDDTTQIYSNLISTKKYRFFSGAICVRGHTI